MSPGKPDMPRCSVVIPAYNSGWCIGAALRSVLAQTAADLEIIVVDDGSTDDTRERVQAFGDARIRYSVQQNAGRAAARNAGIAQARGEWVAFLDADDLWLPRKLEMQLALLRLHPSAVMAYCKAFEFQTRNLVDGSVADVTSNVVKGSGTAGSGDRSREFLLQQPVVFTPTVIARRSALAEIGGYDSQYQYAEDQDLYIRLALSGDIAYDPTPLAAYWRHFVSYRELMRKYAGHHELVRSIRTASALPAVTARHAALAAEAVCVAEWSAALMDVDLGDAACAAQHAAACLASGRTYLYGERAAAQAAERVLDLLGREANVSQFGATLRALIDAAAPPPYRASLVAKALAYYQVDQAFAAYEQHHAWRGLGHAVLAMRWNWRWITNKGLWKMPLMILRKASSLNTYDRG